MRYLLVELDPDSDEIIVYEVMTRCKKLVVKVDDKDVVIERVGDKLVVKRNGGYVAKRVTLKYPEDKQYIFYVKREGGVVEIEAEALY